MSEIARFSAVGPEADVAISPTVQFEAFFEAEKDQLYRALCLVTRNRHEAEDLTQDAFIRVLERWDRVAATEDPHGYLYRTAMNSFRRRHGRALRTAKRSMQLVPADDEIAEIDERDAAARAWPASRLAKEPLWSWSICSGSGPRRQLGCSVSGLRRFACTPPAHTQLSRRRCPVYEYRSVLERAGSNFAPLHLELESLLRRRDRKRRNQRIAAGVVGIAVFVAAFWVVTSLGSLDRSQTSVVPGGEVTLPVETGPVETRPTGPTDTWSTDPLGAGVDEVVAHFDAYNKFVYVYADGRVITHEHASPRVEVRRLTPEGVDLVRSGAIGPDTFLSPYLWADLPEGAWADHDGKEYVPSRYAVCFYQETGDGNRQNGGYEYPSQVLGFFPASAQAILRGQVTRGEAGTAYSPESPECSQVTPEEVDSLDSILQGVRVEDSEGNRIWWEFNGVLPHGGRAACLPCA